MIVGLIATTSISAYRGDYNVKGPNYTLERHEAMQTAFDARDYETWYELMTEDGRQPRVVEVVTEENFAKFVEAHEAAEYGDLEKAALLRAELGLNNGQGPKDGTGHRRVSGKGSGKGSGTVNGSGSREQGRMSNFADSDNNGICDNAV